MSVTDILSWGSLWKKKTPWQLDTSEEESVSILATGGGGRLYFVNEGTGKKFSVLYSFISVGVAKGPPLNYARSYPKDESGGITNVRCRESRDFGPESFPCFGSVLNLGATPGPFGPSFADHGISLAIYFFEAIPFAGIVTWGKFSSILPSAGPSIGFATYSDVREGGAE